MHLGGVPSAYDISLSVGHWEYTHIDQAKTESMTRQEPHQENVTSPAISNFEMGASTSMEGLTIQQISIYNSGCAQVHCGLILTAAWPIIQQSSGATCTKKQHIPTAHDKVPVEGSGHSADMVLASFVCGTKNARSHNE